MMVTQQRAEEVERVTDPAAPDPVTETTKNKRAKDPKIVSAGRAGAAAKKAKMLEALRAAKESLRSSAAPPPHPRERPVFLQSRRTRNMQTNGPLRKADLSPWHGPLYGLVLRVHSSCSSKQKVPRQARRLSFLRISPLC